MEQWSHLFQLGGLGPFVRIGPNCADWAGLGEIVRMSPNWSERVVFKVVLSFCALGVAFKVVLSFCLFLLWGIRNSRRIGCPEVRLVAL